MTGSSYDLAEMARHDLEAAARFPGPDYRQVIASIHRTLTPRTYVEIGVMSGGSLHLAIAGARAIGIDPFPRIEDPRIYRMTSREFFARYDLREALGGPVEFAFIDGCHIFEEALADFLVLECFAAFSALIAIHDTIPLNRETSTRQRTTEFYTGDVWKLVPFLRECRPDLRLVTLAVAPSGLTLVTGLNPQAKTPLDRVEEFAALEFDAFLQNTFA